MERALASIQYIKELEPIEGADFIVKARIKGWSTVVRRDEFKVGDPCVYFEVDSVLPEMPDFEFMRSKNFRVKTMRFKKQLAQGLAVPIKQVSALWGKDSPLRFENDILQIEEGMDVTDIIGVTKYEPPIPTCLEGESLGRRPSHVPKTDEFRLQSYPEILKEFDGKVAYVTDKLDGSSISIFYSPLVKEFGVCSRNLLLAESPNNAYWKVVNKYNLKDIFPEIVESSIKNNNTYVLQGELCGPGINKNRLGLKELDMFIFGVYNASDDVYLPYEEVKMVCEDLSLKTVPFRRYITPYDYDVEFFIEASKGYYEGTKNRKEGIVVRHLDSSKSEVLGGSPLSFKVINPDFLLKDED